ncbi:MAG: tRNA (N(6)-L-threonylcarbamoyladenosine(37)-C(2))-methylthiotransferase MtaB [Clostridiaceae bacterium]|nr:tRNA (N(6)-L-threonylcarbamoyladenosine(37)-C(2))-methylthiotransferase MtaB [Clostridiaceae bacterium]
MKQYTVAFHTLGCKTNHYETDVIARQFSLHGFKQVSFRESADAYIINTCTVTGEADRKSRQMLRRAKQQNPGAIVVAMGCHAELSDTSSYADLCIGTQGKSRAVELVKAALARSSFGESDDEAVSNTQNAVSEPKSEQKKGSAARHSYDNDPLYEELGLSEKQSETRAYLKIEDGCNSFCSYCAIPYARGRVRSRDEEQILQEASILAKAGYKEIVLTGIHLCSYGLDRGEPSHSVAVLASRLADIPQIERIRLGSLEPLSVTSEFLDILENNNKICPHFHLSLQSGCDETLKRMNRNYDTAQFRSVVADIRRRWPFAGITTDIITAFPGETDEEFELSFNFCREMGFSRMHIFRFSPRAGTRAADMPHQVAPAISAARSQRLQELADKMAYDHHALLMSKVETVLLEQIRSDGLMTGYTGSYAQVLVSGMSTDDINKIVKVSFTNFDADFLFGHAVKAL